MPRKVLFVNWIYDTAHSGAFNGNEQSDLQAEIVERVRSAVGRLSPVEREFIHLHWFEGRSLSEISKLLRRRLHIIEGMNKRCLKKLRTLLSAYVAERFGIEAPSAGRCVICNHPHRQEIDAVLREKRPEQTWGDIGKLLDKAFGLRIVTPQIMISHIDYHMQGEVNHG